jgi:hypothetical protein
MLVMCVGELLAGRQAVSPKNELKINRNSNQPNQPGLVQRGNCRSLLVQRLETHCEQMVAVLASLGSAWLLNSQIM